MLLYTRGRGRTKFFQNPDGRETTLATGHQDDNKNTYEANILCSLTFKVFENHTFFSHKTFAITIAETSRRRNGLSPKQPRRTVLDRSAKSTLPTGNCRTLLQRDWETAKNGH